MYSWLPKIGQPDWLNDGNSTLVMLDVILYSVHLLYCFHTAGGKENTICATTEGTRSCSSVRHGMVVYLLCHYCLYNTIVVMQVTTLSSEGSFVASEQESYDTVHMDADIGPPHRHNTMHEFVVPSLKKK